MCGRFVLYSDVIRVREAFNVSASDVELSPRYNIAPTQTVPIVVRRGEGNRLLPARWGLIPRWARDPAIGTRMINARAETLHEKRAFEGLLRSGRCIVPADGFYEWRREGRRKVPLVIALKGRRPFGLAGLHDAWRSPEGERMETFTIVTTAANETLREIHDRMPVILAKADEAAWLDPGENEGVDILGRLGSYPSGEMELHEVSPRVNKPSNDSPENIRPLTDS